MLSWTRLSDRSRNSNHIVIFITNEKGKRKKEIKRAEERGETKVEKRLAFFDFTDDTN